MKALWNGGPPDAELALSRGLHYGDGVFRTVLRWRGEWSDWPLQIVKLAEDCARLRLSAPDERLLREEANRLCAAENSAALKILCLRRTEGRGYRAATAESDRLLIRYPLPQYPRDRWESGVSACRSQLRLARQPALAGIKHLNRLEQVLGSETWPEGTAEVLLCDTEGHPICGTRSNLFWVRNRVVHTPDLAQSGVAGIMRQKLLDLAGNLGLSCRVESYNWADLLAADEIWICNSLIGIWPLRQLDGRAFLAPGPVTQKLAALLKHPVIGDW